MQNVESSEEAMRSRVETERLRALVGNLALGVLVEDEARTIVLANAAFCRLFHIPGTPEQLVGADCALAARKGAPFVVDSDRYLSRIEELLSGRVSALGDEVTFLDGRVLERDYVPIAVDSIRRGHLWLFRDVTQSRKLAQIERAAAVRDELRLAIDTIPGLVWSALANGKVELFNQRWCEYTGLELEEGSGWGWEAMIWPADLLELQARFSDALQAGKPAESEARLRRFDGQYRWFLFRAMPLLGKEGQPTRWYGQAIDIDDRKRSEEALQHAQTELSHVSRVTTLGELAASIAHEINQPISAMVADASACLNRLNAEKPDLNKVRESLAAIVSDGARAGEVLTRIRALLARSALAHQPCSLTQIIQSSVALARSQLARQGIVVEVSLPTDGTTVVGDAVELQQVLLNLLLNAGEAARGLEPDRRRVLIQCRLESERDADWASVSVRDFGVGLDPADFDRLFAAFYTTKPGGLGMGLSIARSIVERHRGRLTASANRDHGATFTFTLPVSLRAEPSAAPSPALGLGTPTPG